MSVRSRFTRLSKQVALGGGVLILSTASITQAAPNQNFRAVFNRTKLPIAEPRPEKVTKVLPSEVPLPQQWEVTAPAKCPQCGDHPFLMMWAMQHPPPLAVW